MNKNMIVETEDALQIIINKLSEDEINLQLTDRSGSFDIHIDETAKQLLKSHYQSKLRSLSY